MEDGLNYEYLQLALGSGELLRVASAFLVLRHHHPTTGKNVTLILIVIDSYAIMSTRGQGRI